MLTGYSTWYTPYSGRIDGKKHIAQIRGAYRMTDISPFAKKSLDPNNPVHFHPSAGVYQTFADSNYISIPFPRYIPPSILHWRWDNIKKKREQFHKTQQYTKAIQSREKSAQDITSSENDKISEEYAGYHKPHVGDYLNINA